MPKGQTVTELIQPDGTTHHVIRIQNVENARAKLDGEPTNETKLKIQCRERRQTRKSNKSDHE